MLAEALAVDAQPVTVASVNARGGHRAVAARIARVTEAAPLPANAMEGVRALVGTAEGGDLVGAIVAREPRPAHAARLQAHALRAAVLFTRADARLAGFAGEARAAPAAAVGTDAHTGAVGGAERGRLARAPRPPGLALADALDALATASTAALTRVSELARISLSARLAVALAAVADAVVGAVGLAVEGKVTGLAGEPLVAVAATVQADAVPRAFGLATLLVLTRLADKARLATALAVDAEAVGGAVVGTGEEELIAAAPAPPRRARAQPTHAQTLARAVTVAAARRGGTKMAANLVELIRAVAAAEVASAVEHHLGAARDGNAPVPRRRCRAHLLRTLPSLEDRIEKVNLAKADASTKIASAREHESLLDCDHHVALARVGWRAQPIAARRTPSHRTQLEHPQPLVTTHARCGAAPHKEPFIKHDHRMALAWRGRLTGGGRLPPTERTLQSPFEQPQVAKRLRVRAAAEDPELAACRRRCSRV